MHLVGFTKEIKNILGFSTKRKKSVYEDHLRPYSFLPPISLFAHASMRSPARPPFCLSVCALLSTAKPFVGLSLNS